MERMCSCCIASHDDGVHMSSAKLKRALTIEHVRVCSRSAGSVRIKVFVSAVFCGTYSLV